MALDENDIPVIVDAVKSIVDRLLAERMESIYGVLEEIREQTFHSVTVLDGNDAALLAEIRKVQHATPAKVLEMAGESWDRFIRAEAGHLGLRIVVPKVLAADTKEDDDG